MIPGLILSETGYGAVFRIRQFAGKRVGYEVAPVSTAFEFCLSVSFGNTWQKMSAASVAKCNRSRAVWRLGKARGL